MHSAREALSSNFSTFLHKWLIFVETPRNH